VQDYHESSKLVTLFTREHGKVNCLAKGARRLKSRFGAALDLLAQSRVIYYWRETRDLYTISDAELLHSSLALTQPPERFLAAEQMAEFVLRVIQPHDPSPQLYGLLVNYLNILEQSPICNLKAEICNALVCSFLLKAASFLGFRPELRRCLICRRPPADHPVFFDSGRGGVVCGRCSGERPSGTLLEPAALDTLSFLLYTPATEVARVCSTALQPGIAVNRQARQDRQDHESDNLQSAIRNLQSPMDLVLDFLSHHFDPLVLNSYRWTSSFGVAQQPAPQS
jgi:DNA repair protein RecO (recombination protein O)